MKNPVVWFDIYVQDMQRAKAFYEGVFNCKLNHMENPIPESGMEMWGFPSDMTSYGASGALTKMNGVASGGNSTVVYLGCEDCATEQGRVAENGGKVLQEKFPIGEHGFIAIIADTEGNTVGLHSEK